MEYIITGSIEPHWLDNSMDTGVFTDNLIHQMETGSIKLIINYAISLI